MVALFLFLKGMTGALAPSSYRVQLKQRIRFPLFERLFRQISVLHGASRRGWGGGMLYVSGALRRMYTLFYPRP
jgi:hypothetical protein